MNEILKEEEVFEVAKKKVIAELEKEYNDIIDKINNEAIKEDAIFIKYRIGVLSPEEYDNIKNTSSKDRMELELKSKKIKRRIKAAQEIIY